MRQLRVAKSWWLLTAAVFLLPAARGQAPVSWIDRRVITRNGTVLTANGRVDEENQSTNPITGLQARTARVYRVGKARGGWLYLTAEKEERVGGWVRVGDVIPYSQAIGYFTDNIRVQPDANNYSGRGVIYYTQARYAEALRDYNEAIRIDPRNEGAYFNRGLLWYDQRQFDRAVADFTGAISLNPLFAPAFFLRADAWFHKKELAKAIADYSQVIELDKKSAPAAYRSRGVVWLLKKDIDKAIADYNEALRLDPGFGKAYVCRADAWYLKKQYDNVIADCSQALRLDPGDVSAHNNRAWVLATCPDDKVRDGKRAVASATRACELTNWKEPGPLGTLAAACAEAGDFDAAVKWEEKAQDLITNEGDRARSRARVALYRARKPYRD